MHRFTQIRKFTTGWNYNSLGTTRIDLRDRTNAYLKGHKLDNRCVYPVTDYIVSAWKAFSATNDKQYEQLPITFENVSLERPTFLKEDKPISLNYTFLNGNGTEQFVIKEEGIAVFRGTITASTTEDVEKKMFNLPPVQIPDNPQRRSLKAEDIYREFQFRGFNYSGEFRGIQNIDNSGKWAQVAWRGNWTSFLDSVLQTSFLTVMARTTAIPVRFKSINIDPVKFFDYIKSQEEGNKSSQSDPLIPVSIYPSLGTIKCPGVEFRGLTSIVVPRKKQKETLSVEEYTFSPYFDKKAGLSKSPLSVNSNIAGLIDLVIENSTATKLKIVDVFANVENSFTETITNIVNLRPNLKADVEILSTWTEIDKLDEKIKNLAVNVSGKKSTKKLVLDSGLVDLVFLDEPSQLSKIADVIQENSHIILRSSEASQEIKPVKTLQRVSEKLSNDVTLTLFKKISPNAPVPTIKSAICVDNVSSEWIPNLKSQMAEITNEQSSSARIYLYSQNSPHSGIVGITKYLRQVSGGDKLRCIFDPQGLLKLDFKNPGTELKKIIEQDLAINVVKNGNLGSYRHIPMRQDGSTPSKEVQHAYVNTLTTGDLTSLRWIESPLAYTDTTKKKTRGEVCTVHYAAMNFKDIMMATGKLPVDLKTAYNPQDCVLGFEFSGVDSNGNRVMGVMPSKAMASSVLIDPECLTWNVPDKWTLEEAATTPVVYATAYYALFNRAKIQRKQSILIHCGTGGVGQAAINIALDLDCEIYTTAGTDEKRRKIKELYPSLKEENIGNSRDCSFEQMVTERTNGRGVDIVLNSLADDKLQASVRCVAVHGKFLEIGAFDSFQNSNLGMDCFLKNIEFQGIFLNHFLSGSQADRDTLVNHFLNGIKSGVLKPIPHTVFGKDEIEDAFRYMAGGKHVGKVLIEVQKEESIGSKPKIMAVPRSYFSADKYYVVVGGLGGLGLEVANWLVDRGARHLVLTSRSGVTTGYQELCLRKWEERGVTVETPKVDLADYNVAEELIKSLAADEKPIGGIFNTHLVFKDSLIDELNNQAGSECQYLQAAAAPRIQITKNLDQLTRQYCSNGLDHFVMFSSMTSGFGSENSNQFNTNSNATDCNYGLVNSVLQQVCESRKSDGLHGLTIQWNVAGEDVENINGAELTDDEIFDGTLAQRISSCLEVLDMTLHRDAFTVSAMFLPEKKLKKVGLLESISHMYGVNNVGAIDRTKKLVDLGLDSLIGMEIKQLIERDYDTPLTANEIRMMTFNDLLMIEAGTYVKGQSLHPGKVAESANSTSGNTTPLQDSIYDDDEYWSQYATEY